MADLPSPPSSAPLLRERIAQTFRRLMQRLSFQSTAPRAGGRRVGIGDILPNPYCAMDR
jgi:hypothetical protein